MAKPHKGRIAGAVLHETPTGDYYTGKFLDHPQFAGKYGHTSILIKDNRDVPRHNRDSYEIETFNSRYTIIPYDAPNKPGTTISP